MRREIACGDEVFSFDVPRENVVWELRPDDLPPVEDEGRAVREALENPIGTARLKETVSPGMKVVILSDDFTRPTPRKLLLPPILDELNEAGVEDRDIRVIIALGAHRYMTDEEIAQCFGEEILSRVEVVNHRWMDQSELVDLGETKNGTPIVINREAYEADFLIGVGSIVPHTFAGFSGGGKIVQPGISGSATTAATHFLLCKEGDRALEFAGTIGNPAMNEMREVAKRAGLEFIVNVVFNSRKELVDVVAGDIVQAHEVGIEVSGDIFIREIQSKADIVIVDAHPAETDMWQATKPLSYSRRAVKDGGTVIFVTAAPDGIAPTHPSLEERGTLCYSEIKRMMLEDEWDDRVAGSILLVIKKGTEGVDVWAVSKGLTREMKEKMSLMHAESIQEGLERAFEKHGSDATVGIIHHGGDVLPVLEDRQQG